MRAVVDGVVVVGCGGLDVGDGGEVDDDEDSGVEVDGVVAGDVALGVAVWLLPHALIAMAAAMAAVAAL
jgi:hypothetical protein